MPSTNYGLGSIIMDMFGLDQIPLRGGLRTTLLKPIADSLSRSHWFHLALASAPARCEEEHTHEEVPHGPHPPPEPGAGPVEVLPPRKKYCCTLSDPKVALTTTTIDLTLSGSVSGLQLSLKFEGGLAVEIFNIDKITDCPLQCADCHWRVEVKVTYTGKLTVKGDVDGQPFTSTSGPSILGPVLEVPWSSVGSLGGFALTGSFTGDSAVHAFVTFDCTCNAIQEVPDPAPPGLLGGAGVSGATGTPPGGTPAGTTSTTGAGGSVPPGGPFPVAHSPCPRSNELDAWEGREDLNCYNFALGDMTHPNAQPGTLGPNPAPLPDEEFTPAQLDAALRADGLVPSSRDTACQHCHYKIAVVALRSPLNPGQLTDFHFLRHAYGRWSHKNGALDPVHTDSEGEEILDPEQTLAQNRFPVIQYDYFQGYYCVPSLSFH